jgi:hypothetical protein
MDQLTEDRENRRQFALLTGQWNFPALLHRIVRDPERPGN